MLKLGYRKEYSVWLALYMAVNIIAGVTAYYTGVLTGDVDGFRVYDNSALFIACAVEVCCYYFILKTLYNFTYKLECKQLFNIWETDKSNRILGSIVLVLQTLLIVVSLKEGVNTAGSSAKSDSLWSLFWIFVPTDMIFLIYYGFKRDDKMFKYNLLIYILSNLLRGWSGVFLYIIFLEWCRAYRKNAIKFKKVAIVVGLVIALYPALLSLKWLARASAGDLKSMSDVIHVLADNLSGASYWEMLLEGMNHLVGRLQHSTMIVEIMHYRELLQDEFAKGAILPFWSDGLPQLIYRKVFGIHSPPNIGVALTDYLFPPSIEKFGAWNVSVGFSGWFYLVPDLIWLYLLYMFFLCFLSVFFIKQIGKNEGSSDVLWLAWLIFIMQGWIAAFVGFIYAILLFIFIQLIAQKLSAFTLRQKPDNR